MKITPKPVVPQLTARQAFTQQRSKENGSHRLRLEVARLLNEGKASTDVVGEVFQLIVTRMSGTGRITNADVARVLKDFDVTDNGW